MDIPLCSVLVFLSLPENGQKEHDHPIVSSQYPAIFFNQYFKTTKILQ